MEMNQKKILNVDQSYFLLWVTIMNQSQKSKIVIQNTLELMKRLKRVKNFTLLEIEKIFIEPNCLHRFPKKMSKNIHDSIWIINTFFHGDVRNVFVGNENEVFQNLIQFSGIGGHKAKIGARIYSLYKQVRYGQRLISYADLECSNIENTIMDELNILNVLESDRV